MTIYEMQEQGQVALGSARNEEMFSHVLMTLLAELGSKGRIGKEVTDLICRPLYGMGEETCVLVDDLEGNATHRRGHHGLLLPQTFGDREAKPLA